MQSAARCSRVTRDAFAACRGRWRAAACIRHHRSRSAGGAKDLSKGEPDEGRRVTAPHAAQDSARPDFAREPRASNAGTQLAPDGSADNKAENTGSTRVFELLNAPTPGTLTAGASTSTH